MHYRISACSLFVLVFQLHTLNSAAQVVYQDVSNQSIYEFLDEMANENVIVINSVIRPCTRRFIAEKLMEIQHAKGQLNTRQKAELEFYLRDYNKELLHGKFENKRFDVFYYDDSLFTFSLNGILGGQGWNNENGFNYHRWYGAEAFSYMGKGFGIYASLRDNTEKIPLADTMYITTRDGGKYRDTDYSEMRGGLTWAWKWGNLALVKEHILWGQSYRYPNIISSRAPSFAQVRLNLKPVHWFEFNFVHGWLVSEVVDSSHSYTYNGVRRDVFHDKYIAANMFTFTPWKRFNFSFGNSVIYSDQNFNPAYFIPVFFFKSVDHTYNGATNNAGQNSQMYFNLSSRLIRKTHMYYSMFIDVLSFGSVFDEEMHANHWSMLGGIRYSNILPNLSLTLEYIRNNPLVYKNDILTTQFNSNWYTLGHYLGDNAQEIYGSLDYRPWKTLLIQFRYSLAQKGPDYPYTRERDPVTGISPVLGKQFMERVEWQQQLIGLRARYQVINDLFVFVECEMTDTGGNAQKYTPPFYYGSPTTVSFGLNLGF